MFFGTLIKQYIEQSKREKEIVTREETRVFEPTLQNPLNSFKMDDNSCCCHQSTSIDKKHRKHISMETSISIETLASGFFKFLARFSGMQVE